MASPNMASSSATTLEVAPRQPAGPLPSKRGEIGYVEGVHGQPSEDKPTTDSSLDAMPARHPADRRSPTPLAGGPAADGSHAAPTTPPSASDSSSMNSMSKRSFFKNKKIPKYGGISLFTLLLLSVQLLFLAGTITGWVLVFKVFGNKLNASSNGDAPATAGGSTIFIHVAFAVVVLSQLVLLERRIFRLRAERYMHLHPGEMLPTSLRRTTSLRNAGMPLAPWHRPPIPTYAAALAQSGYGTGDAEDAEIAQPPPPAYGKTRGSTLLLSGFLRNSLRAQAQVYEEDQRQSHISTRSDRPVSFVSRDEEWEERRDAERARRVEEALTVLEQGHDDV